MLGPRKFIFVFVSYIAVYFSLVNGQYEDPEEEPEPEAEPESSKIKIGKFVLFIDSSHQT